MSATEQSPDAQVASIPDSSPKAVKILLVVAGIFLLVFFFSSEFQSASEGGQDWDWIANIFASPTYVVTYVLLLASFALAHAWRYRVRLNRLKADVGRIEENAGPDEDAQLAVTSLARLCGARIRIRGGNPAVVDADDTEGRIGLESVGNLLRVTALTPAANLAADGLFPSEEYFLADLRRRIRPPDSISDVLIRIGLLGTFIGLVAGLYQTAALVGDDPQALNLLLDTSVYKFIISVAALAFSLLFKAYLEHGRRRLEGLAARLSRTIDPILSPSIAAGWIDVDDPTLIELTRCVRGLTKELENAMAIWSRAGESAGAGG